MSTYVERAIKFIKAFTPYIQNCQTVNEYIDATIRFNTEHHRMVIVCNGSARVAFLTSDYVVKIDYNPFKVEEWGGCEAELKFYHKACEEGYGYLFAPISYYYHEGFDYYIMPRISGIEKYEYDADEYMTEDEADWCWDIGLRDLHCANYGWKNGKVIIFDYAANNYREQTSVYFHFDLLRC